MAGPSKQIGVRLFLDDDGFFSGLNKANGATDALGRGMNTGGVGAIAFGNILANLTTGALRAVTDGLLDAAKAGVGFLADSFGMAADLEEQMSGIEAVSGATADQMEALKKTVSDLGIDPNLKVSAEQAAGAIEELVRNGVEIQDIIDGVARSTVFLANSAGADLSLSADVMAKTMKIFNIEASDTIRVVNGISGVVNQSAYDVNDFALMLAQGGGTAAAFGMSLEELNTTFVATQAQFTSGSDAGTALRNFLVRLVPQTDEAANAMRELGLFTGLTDKETKKITEKIGKLNAQIGALDPTAKNYAKRLQELTDKKNVLTSSLVTGQNAFFDEEGSLKDMGEIAGLLETAFSGLNDEQRITLTQQAFLTDGSRVAIELAKQGEEGYRKYAAAIAGVDAEASAAARNDNFNSAMETLRGVIDSVRTTAMKPFLDTFADWTRLASTFVQENSKPVIDFFAQVGAGVKVFGDELLAGQEPLKAFFDGLSAGGASGEVIGTIGGIIDKVTGLAGSIKAFVTEDGPKFIEGIKAMGAIFAATRIAAAIGGIVTAVGLLLTPVGALTAAIAGVGLAYATNFGGFKDWVDTNIPIVQETITGFVGETIAWFEKFPTETLPKLIGFFHRVSDGFNDLLGPAIREFMNEVGPPFNEMVSGWMTTWDEFKTRAQPVIDEFTKNFKAKWDEVGPQITESMTLIGDALGRIVGLFIDTSDKGDELDLTMGILKATLDLTVNTLNDIKMLFEGIAWGLDKVADALTIAKGLWSQFNDIARLTLPSVPPWLIPGSPPPFAMGLLDVSNSLSSVNRGMGDLVGNFGQLNQQAFAPPASASQIRNQATNVYDSRTYTVNQTNNVERDMPFSPLSELETTLASYT